MRHIRIGLVNATTAAGAVLAATGAAAGNLLATHAHLSGLQSVGLAVTLTLSISAVIYIGSNILSRKYLGPEEEEAAVARISAILHSLLTQHGIDKSEIHPTLKLLESPNPILHAELQARLPSATMLNSRLWIARMADWPRCTLILGDSGSGKTSLLLRLSQQMLAQRTRGVPKLIPLYLPCRAWSPEYTSLKQWVEEKAAEAYGTPEKISDNWIRAGKILLVLDGFDEVPEDRSGQFIDAVNAWTRAAEGTRIVITARGPVNEAAAEGVRWLQADQLAFLQPLSNSAIQTHLRVALKRLTDQTGLSSIQGMDSWLERLIAENDYLRGPALIGMLSESAQWIDSPSENFVDASRRSDPANFALLLANEFLEKGDLEAAREAYEAVTRLSYSRSRGPAAALLGLCWYGLGDTEKAHEAMLRSVYLRLHESIEPATSAIERLSEDERKCLQALPAENISYDLGQLSSAARLPMGVSRRALQTLRERGLVEAVGGAGKDDRVRFRRSISAVGER